MLLKSSRKVLCFIFTLIIVAGNFLFIGSLVARYTIASGEYINIFLGSDKVLGECDENFKKGIESVAEESLIPSRVFEAILSDETLFNENAVQRLFSNGNASFYSEDIIEKFESLCIEYLNGNEISYNKAAIHNTALKAAAVFSDSYGIKNAKAFEWIIDSVTANSPKYSSTGILLVVLAVAFILLIQGKKKAKSYCAYAFAASGISLALTGIVGAFVGTAGLINITPHIYGNMINMSFRFAYIILFVTGVMIAAAAYYIAAKQYKHDVIYNS